jgi:hypothetical protein
MKILAVAGMAGLLAIVAAHAQMGMTTPSNGTKAGPVVDSAGNLRVPDAYRTSYQFLGAWAIAADQGPGSKEFHTVYASPGTIDVYRKDGRFPDGSVLVKEVYQAATGKKTTGTVSHAENLKGWFVMVKGENGRYPGNALWGADGSLKEIGSVKIPYNSPRGLAGF